MLVELTECFDGDSSGHHERNDDGRRCSREAVRRILVSWRASSIRFDGIELGGCMPVLPECLQRMACSVLAR